MLSIFWEMVFTLLASVGLASILWVLLARRILPTNEEKYGVFAVVRGRGDGTGLEQNVRDLLWLRRCNMYHGTILLIDCGLDEEGRALARLLCANSDEVLLCDEAELSKLIFDT